MKNFLHFMLFVSVMLSIGCSTENPLCTTNYCVIGEVFEKSDLEQGQAYDNLPANISEQSLINLFSIQTPGDFQPVTVTGTLDWDFSSEEWQYREDRVTYLKKVTLEMLDEGKFGDNRVILVLLNKDTVRRDAESNEHVDFLGTGTVRLTEWVNIGTFRGDIVGAPVKGGQNTPEENIFTQIPPVNGLVANGVTLADIIDDVAAGNKTYLNQTVTVTGYVVWKNDDRDGIAIYPTNDNIASLESGAFFFITDRGNPETLNPYSVGTKHTFKIMITVILDPNEGEENYVIGSILVG